MGSLEGTGLFFLLCLSNKYITIPPSQNRLIFTHLEGSKPQKFELTISPETLGDFEPLVNGNRIPVAGAVLVFTLIVTFSFRRQLIFVRHVAMEMELTLPAQASP